MNQIDRYVFRSFQIDTNRINSRGHCPNMNQLEQWYRDGVIQMDMSEVAQRESRADRDQKRVEKTFDYVYSETLANTHEEQEWLRKIETILFPKGAKNSNQRNDVEIVFNANKYGSILITADGASKSQPNGILGHKVGLKELGIVVMSDEEAVTYVRDLIQKRDQQAIKEYEIFGVQLPDWIGKD